MRCSKPQIQKDKTKSSEIDWQTEYIQKQEMLLSLKIRYEEGM